MSESLADVVHEAVERAKAGEERKPVTLTEFLLARIAEDDATARHDYVYAMTGSGWHHYPEAAYNELQSRTLDASRRMGAECEAKREIVALHNDSHDDGDPRSWDWPYVGCATLRAVALPYSEHPDFDPAWRP